jgi:hypothetical protein
MQLKKMSPPLSLRLPPSPAAGSPRSDRRNSVDAWKMAEPFRDRSKFRTFCGFLFIYSSNEILLCLRRERTPPPDPGFLNDEHGDFTRRLCSCCIFFLRLTYIIKSPNRYVVFRPPFFLPALSRRFQIGTKAVI